MKTLIKSILLVTLLAISFASCTNYDDDVQQENIENTDNGEVDMDDGSKE